MDALHGSAASVESAAYVERIVVVVVVFAAAAAEEEVVGVDIGLEIVATNSAEVVDSAPVAKAYCYQSERDLTLHECPLTSAASAFFLVHPASPVDSDLAAVNGYSPHSALDWPNSPSPSRSSRSPLSSHSYRSSPSADFHLVAASFPDCCSRHCPIG